MRLFNRSILCCLTASFLGGFLCPLRAQIAETIQQCDEKYGPAIPPTDATSDVRFYKKDGITIKVLFIEGKAEVITFSAVAGSTLEDQQQLALLEKNAGGSKWEEVVGAGPRTWAREDGEVFGFYDTSKGELTVMTATYLNKASQEVEASPVAHSPAK